jgi:uncharacterized protein (DUF952 family)
MNDNVPVVRAPTARAEVVYKIMSRTMWNEALTKSHFVGSSDDIRDGFIHFSQAHQVASTLARHFQGQNDLVLIAVKSAALGKDLVWEPSRGGELFPHLYASLPTALAIWSRTIDLDTNGIPKCDPAWLTC